MKYAKAGIPEHLDYATGRDNKKTLHSTRKHVGNTHIIRCQQMLTQFTSGIKLLLARHLLTHRV